MSAEAKVEAESAMANRDVISTRQFMAMVFVSVLSALLHRAPEAVVNAGGVPASWLAPVAAVIPIFLIAWIMNRLMRGRNEGEGLTDVFIKVLGSGGGKLLALVFAAWPVFYAGIILRSGGERLVSMVYKSQNVNVFIIVAVIIALIGASGKLTALASSAEIFLLFMAGILLLVFGFSILDIETENLFPVSYLDTVPVLKASIPIVYTISPFVFLYFLAGRVKKEEKSLKVTLRWLISIVVVALALLITTIGIFGVNLMGEVQSAFFSMAQNISIFGTVQRIESIVVGVWVAADFVMIASMIMVSCEIIAVAFGISGRKIPALSVGIAVALVAFLCAPNAFILDKIFERIVPVVTISLIYIVMPVLFIIGKIRKRL